MRELRRITRGKRAIAFLLVFGVVIRTVYFFINLKLGGVDIDEAMLADNANSIVNNGTDILGNRYPIYFPTWLYGGQSPAATYMSALSVAVFGSNLFALRLPMLILSVFGFVCCIGIGHELFESGGRSELIFDGLCAVSPWMIFSGAYVLDCNCMGYNLMFALYFFIRAYKKNKMSLYVLSMLFFSLCFYSYIASILFVPAFLAVLYLILLIKKRIGFKACAVSVASITVFSSAFIIFGLVLIKAIKPFELGFISFPDMEYYARNGSLSTEVSNFGRWAYNFLDVCKKLIFVDTSYIYVPKLSFQYTNLLGGIFALLGALSLTLKKIFRKKTEYASLTVYVALAGLAAFALYCISVNGFVAYRYGIFSVILIILATIGIDEILNLLKGVDEKDARKIICVYLALSFSLFSVETVVYANKMNNCPGLMFLDSFGDCLEYSEGNNIEDINILVNYDSYGVIDGGVDIALRYYLGGERLNDYYDNIMLWYAKSADEEKHSFQIGAFTDKICEYRAENIEAVTNSGIKEAENITLYSTIDTEALTEDYYIVDNKAIEKFDCTGYKSISFGAFCVLQKTE